MMKHFQYFNIAQILYLLCDKTKIQIFFHDLLLLVHHDSLGNLVQQNYQEIIAPVPYTMCMNTVNMQK